LARASRPRARRPGIGTTGPTPELYNTPEAFAFIRTLDQGRYITIIMALVHVAALICLWTRRTALAALLILPITVNVVAFHAFLDGGLLTPGAVLSNIMLLVNVYLWQCKCEYQPLLRPASP
jgi:hypothetical protein